MMVNSYFLLYFKSVSHFFSAFMWYILSQPYAPRLYSKYLMSRYAAISSRALSCIIDLDFNYPISTMSAL